MSKLIECSQLCVLKRACMFVFGTSLLTCFIRFTVSPLAQSDTHNMNLTKMASTSESWNTLHYPATTLWDAGLPVSHLQGLVHTGFIDCCGETTGNSVELYRCRCESCTKLEWRGWKEHPSPGLGYTHI